MPALRSRGLMNSSLASAEEDGLVIRKALVHSLAAEQDWQTFLKIDPGNAIAYNNLLASASSTFGNYWELGRIGEAQAKARMFVAAAQKPELSAMIAVNLAGTISFVALFADDTGNPREAENARALQRKMLDIALKGVPEDSFERHAAPLRIELFGVSPLFSEGDDRAAREVAEKRLARVEGLKPANPGQERAKNLLLLYVHRQLAYISYRLHDYMRAEAEPAQADQYLKRVPPRSLREQRDASDQRMVRALALARLGRAADALPLAAGELQMQRELAMRPDNSDLTQRVQLAQALYASAMAGDPKRGAQLKEAAAAIDALPPDMRGLRSVGRLRGWIADEQNRS